MRAAGHGGRGALPDGAGLLGGGLVAGAERSAGSAGAAAGGAAFPVAGGHVETGGGRQCAGSVPVKPFRRTADGAGLLGCGERLTGLGQQLLGGAQIHADKARYAALDHGHAEQAVHSAHRHGIMGDDQIARLGLARHRLQQIAETLDIGIVERSVHFVQHADGRGIGQEQRENQRHRRQRLLPARQQAPPPADHPNRP
ncbi:hypothetical protein E4T56_gene8370, partial [Termitomyces sp. T112]